MGFRTVIVSDNCKLSYKNEYLIIRKEELKMIHLSEINVLIIETGMVLITSYLLNELAKHKIKVIFCDEKHNPSCEIVSLYGAHNTSKKVSNQISWTESKKKLAWQQIVKHKIHNQAMMLKKLQLEGYEKLLEYEKQVEVDDVTNREGLAAKVYFGILFGKSFFRGDGDDINICLDYGYSILLSLVNKEVVSKGYITQIGINHKNEFNQFNLSCDLMEIFRPLVDEIVYNNKDKVFDKELKYRLIDVYNKSVVIEKKKQYLSNATSIFLSSVFNFLESKEAKLIINYEF